MAKWWIVCAAILTQGDPSYNDPFVLQGAGAVVLIAIEGAALWAFIDMFNPRKPK